MVILGIVVTMLLVRCPLNVRFLRLQRDQRLTLWYIGKRKQGFSEEPRHLAMYLLDTRWKQMHNAMRVREGTVTITRSHPHSRWSFCAQGHSILSQYQASYAAILAIATSLSLNTLFGVLYPLSGRVTFKTGATSRPKDKSSHKRPNRWLKPACHNRPSSAPAVGYPSPAAG
jgi:hypothetical protein